MIGTFLGGIIITCCIFLVCSFIWHVFLREPDISEPIHSMVGTFNKRPKSFAIEQQCDVGFYTLYNIKDTVEDIKYKVHVDHYSREVYILSPAMELTEDERTHLYYEVYQGLRSEYIKRKKNIEKKLYERNRNKLKKVYCK